MENEDFVDGIKMIKDNGQLGEIIEHVGNTFVFSLLTKKSHLLINIYLFLILLLLVI